MTSFLAALAIASAQFMQSQTGELRLVVTDPAGFPIQAAVEIVGEANQFHERFATDAQGRLTARRLRFGAYQVTVTREGFADAVSLVDVRSAAPTERHVTLALAPMQTQLTV